MSTLSSTDVKFIYVTIPAEYVCIYNKILILLSEYGEQILYDCKASCKDRNVNIIDCYNTFNAAVAARQINKTKLAETLISYVKAKLKQLYNTEIDQDKIIYTIDDTGEKRAIVHCSDNPEFYVESNE